MTRWATTTSNRSRSTGARVARTTGAVGLATSAARKSLLGARSRDWGEPTNDKHEKCWRESGAGDALIRAVKPAVPRVSGCRSALDQSADRTATASSSAHERAAVGPPCRLVCLWE